MTWRYLAIQLHGDGSQTLLHPELPLKSPRIISTLSGPDALVAGIEPEITSMTTPSGHPIFREWSTLILAEKDGRIRGGGILDTMTIKDSQLRLDCVGPTGYARDMPYTDADSWIGIDPLDIAHHIWNHLQAQSGGNLGMIVKSNNSPVRIGTKERDVNFITKEGEDVSFTAGPYVLAHWNAHDLGREFDDLAKETPFQYRTSWEWVGDKAVPTLDIQYPSIGRRLTEPRFVVGENVFEVPVLEFAGDGYASDVLVLGAGSGRNMVSGFDNAPNADRLRRVRVLEDKSITSKARATAVARAELKMLNGEAEVTDLMVINHPNAPLGSYQVGDEILVTIESGWSARLDVWCKVVSLEIDPVTESVQVQVVRTEKVG